MNAYGEDLPRCYFHPKQAVVGICSLCLRERLLIILASKQGHQHQAKDTHRSLQVLKGKLAIYLPRFFLLSSIFHRLKFQHQRTNDNTFDEGSVPSPDSFISIKFDDDQHEGLERSSVKPSLGPKKGGGSMVEYVKEPGKPRWRTRIGRLFIKLARWKGSPRPGTCEEKTGGWKGWIRSLRRRTTSE